MIPSILEAYQQHTVERQKLGIPPLPLNPEEVKALAEMVLNSPSGKEEFILKLLKENVPPGVDPAALEKAKLLRSIALREKQSKLISPLQAVQMLGMMKGGYNIETLIELLEDKELGDAAVRTLSGTILVFRFFDRVKELARTNKRARKVMESWGSCRMVHRKPQTSRGNKSCCF